MEKFADFEILASDPAMIRLIKAQRILTDWQQRAATLCLEQPEGRSPTDPR